jgi:hypothetical protein
MVVPSWPINMLRMRLTIILSNHMYYKCRSCDERYHVHLLRVVMEWINDCGFESGVGRPQSHTVTEVDVDTG